MMLHYGILSTASIVGRFVKAVQKAGDEVVAIASRDLAKAQQKANEYRIPIAYGNYQELFENPDIDIIYIATNNGTHVQYCKDAFAHGKHVICEKPLALSKQDAEDLFAMAREKKRFLMEAQKSVFLPITKEVKRLMDSAPLGKLHQIEFSLSFPYTQTPWMKDPKQAGVLYASGSYIIEYLQYLLHPVSWNMQAMATREDSGAIDCINMNFLLNDEIMVNGRISRRGNTHKHAVFYFEHGYLLVPVFWKARKAYLYDEADKCVQTFDYPIDYEMIYEVEHIHQCLEKKLLTSPVMNAEMSIHCCAAVDALHEMVQ